MMCPFAVFLCPEGVKWIMKRVEKKNLSRITDWCQAVMESRAPRGGLYIDATMGNGNDTLFLCQMAGKDGQVLAFDAIRVLRFIVVSAISFSSASMETPRRS